MTFEHTLKEITDCSIKIWGRQEDAHHPFGRGILKFEWIKDEVNNSSHIVGCRVSFLGHQISILWAANILWVRLNALSEQLSTSPLKTPALAYFELIPVGKLYLTPAECNPSSSSSEATLFGQWAPAGVLITLHSRLELWFNLLKNRP